MYKRQVVMCGMIILFLSPSVGVINNIVQFFGGDPVNFMAKKEYWRHIYVWTGIWQGMGWSSVIYFAALSGISPELHEAAKCDGATKLQLIRHIDLPSIMPTATVLLIMNCGSILSIGFEKAYLLQNDLNLNVSEIISTYVYKVGLINNDMSYSCLLYTSTFLSSLYSGMISKPPFTPEVPRTGIPAMLIASMSRYIAVSYTHLRYGGLVISGRNKSGGKGV